MGNETPEFELCGGKHYHVEGSPFLLASHSISFAVAVCIECCPVDQEEKENVLSPKMALTHSLQTIMFCVGFEVFTVVVMKSIIFWDMTPCSLLSCNSMNYTASSQKKILFIIFWDMTPCSLLSCNSTDYMVSYPRR
jgi:hypothetical protein